MAGLVITRYEVQGEVIDQLAKAEITLNEMKVMLALIVGNVTFEAICKYTDLQKGNVSRVLKKLSARGVIDLAKGGKTLEINLNDPLVWNLHGPEDQLSNQQPSGREKEEKKERSKERKEERENIAPTTDVVVADEAGNTPNDPNLLRERVGYFVGQVKARFGFAPIVAAKDIAVMKRALSSEILSDHPDRFKNLVDFYLWFISRRINFTPQLSVAFSSWMINEYMALWGKKKWEWGDKKYPPVAERWWE